eukprot:PhF_6_TR30434/c0_g1_i1/m.44674
MGACITTEKQQDRRRVSITLSPYCGGPRERPLREEDDDPSQNANLSFYQNITPSVPNGTLIEVMLETWQNDYNLLEEHHGYIQWLFPSPQHSSYNEATQPLRFHEAKAIREDPVLVDRYKRAFRMMAKFYGCNLSVREGAYYAHTADHMERRRNLRQKRHNALRITRMLTSCHHVLQSGGGQELQRPLMVFFADEIFGVSDKESLGAFYRQAYLNYWVKAITRKEDYDYILSYV